MIGSRLTQTGKVSHSLRDFGYRSSQATSGKLFKGRINHDRRNIANSLCST
jgi:hypothetical protein